MSKTRPPRPEAPRTRATPSASSRGVPKAEPNALQAAVDRLEARVVELKRERDAMAADLASAKAEIAALDASRIDAINRIDWVLDSLHTVLQDKP